MPVTLQEYKSGVRTVPKQPTDKRKKRKKISLADYKLAFAPKAEQSAPAKQPTQAARTEFKEFPNAVKPNGGSEGRILPNGNLAYTTPSGTIWEYTKDGRRIVKLAAHLGGGGWEDTGAGTGLIGTAEERQAKRNYAGVPSVTGKERDHIIPVSLGGISDSKTNIRQVGERDNPADLEGDLAEKVRNGEISLMEARKNIMVYKQEKFMGGEPDLTWLEKRAVDIADGVKMGGRILAKPVVHAVTETAKDLTMQGGDEKNQSLALQYKNQKAAEKGEKVYKSEDELEVDRLYNQTGINAAREKKGLKPITDPKEAFMMSPMGKALNSPQGKAAIKWTATNTQDLGLKWWAAAQTDDPIVRKIFNKEDKTYEDVLAELKANKNKEDNGPVKRFLYALQDSGPQTLIGVGLSLLTKGRDRGILSSTYFGAISANEQLEKEGEINSPGKIAIDVAGDRLLTSRLETLFKAPSKSLLLEITKNFGIEGGTEVAQSIAKMGVDYQNADTDEEREAIIKLAKEYVKDGDAALEFAVGGFMGGGTTAVVNTTSPGTPQTDITDNTANISVGREDEEYVIEDGKLVVNEKTPIAPSVVQTINPTTGEKKFFTVNPEDFEETKKLIDGGEDGIAGKMTDGEVWHITAKSPEQMVELGFTDAGQITPDKIPGTKKKVFNTDDEYVYHVTPKINKKNTILEEGLKPSKTGHGGPGVYMANTPDKTLGYSIDKLEDGVLYRIKKADLIKEYGLYSKENPDGVEFDDYSGEVILAGNRTIPAKFIEEVKPAETPVKEPITKPVKPSKDVIKATIVGKKGQILYRGVGGNRVEAGHVNFAKGSQSYSSHEQMASLFGDEISTLDISGKKFFDLDDTSNPAVKKYDKMMIKNPEQAIAELQAQGFDGIRFDGYAEEPNVADDIGEDVYEYQLFAEKSAPNKAISEKALGLTKANGGVTINLNGDIPTKGYSVATDKATEKVIKLDKITQKDVDSYIDEHFEDLQKEGNYLGMWIDEGQIYLDVPTVFTDKVAAVKAGKAADQLGIFDLETFETINSNQYEEIIADGQTQEGGDKGRVQKESSKDTSRKGYKAEGAVNDLREFVLSKNKEATSSQRAGIVRKLNRLENNLNGNPSQSELLKAQKYLTSNYKGKEVVYNGKPAVIAGSSYGLIGIRQRGKITYVMPNELKIAKPSKSDVISYIQKEAEFELNKEAKLYSFKPKGKKIEVEEIPKVYESEAKPRTGDKTSKIARSIEAKAVEADLTEGFKDVAGYESINLKEQAEIATKLVNEDIEQTRAIIRGELPLPANLKGTALITAMEKYIKANPDANLAYELANSPLISVTSEAAQELRLAAERNPDSATAKLLQIKKAREGVVSKDIVKRKAKVKAGLKEEINKVHLSKEDQQWDKFLESIKC